MEDLSPNPYPLSKDARDALDKIKAADRSPMAGVFQALADPARVMIVEALGRRELCVCVLVDLTGLGYSTLSYHLKMLKDAGLVQADKDGNYQIYSLTPRGRKAYRFIGSWDRR